MVNDDLYPSRLASRRRMRTQAEWKVEIHMRCATGPTSATTRCRISSAALLVKVMARISNGETPCSALSQATRRVRTRVFPEPAPATTSNGPPGWVTAATCTGFRSASREDVAVSLTRPTVLDGTDQPADHLIPWIGQDGRCGRSTKRRSCWDDRHRRRPDRQPPRVRGDAHHGQRDLGRTTRS